MWKRGRGKVQIEKWRENHQRLADLLIQSGNYGMTKMELHKGSGSTLRERLSRPSIDKHLRKFEDAQKLIREGRRFVWKANIEAAEAMRTRTLKHAFELVQRIKKNIKEEMKNEFKDVKNYTETTEFELERFLNFNCITFIGDVPCTFHKSVEGIQSQIAFENNLRQRHQSDLERFREEFIRAHMKKDKSECAAVEARIKDEVGWTVGEYLKKLLNKAEKEEGIHKIMTVLGITEEMLEEITKSGESEAGRS
jgi:hypothetical protein